MLAIVINDDEGTAEMKKQGISFYFRHPPPRIPFTDPLSWNEDLCGGVDCWCVSGKNASFQGEWQG